MTREDIIRMASEAGFETKRGMVWVDQVELTRSMQRFAALVAAQEREACARVCEEYDTARQDNYACLCAAAIRKRGEVKP